MLIVKSGVLPFWINFILYVSILKKNLGYVAVSKVSATITLLHFKIPMWSLGKFLLSGVRALSNSQVGNFFFQESKI